MVTFLLLGGLQFPQFLTVCWNSLDFNIALRMSEKLINFVLINAISDSMFSHYIEVEDLLQMFFRVDFWESFTMLHMTKDFISAIISESTPQSGLMQALMAVTIMKPWSITGFEEGGEKETSTTTERRDETTHISNNSIARRQPPIAAIAASGAIWKVKTIFNHDHRLFLL